MIQGHFKISQEGKTVIECDNHLTAAGAKLLLASLNSAFTTAPNYPGYTKTITLGSGAVTPSFDAAIQTLVATIPTANVVITGSYGTTDFDVVVTGTIAANTYGSAAITEIGINAYGPFDAITYAWTSTTSVSALIGYISAPTDFASTDIDVTKALTIEWRLRFSYI